LYYWRRLLRRSAPRNTCTALRSLALPARASVVQRRCDVNLLWLDNLWVLPEFMGRGIGPQLFQHALERSRERGESVLKIEADPNAQSFYEKMGARQIGEHHSEVDGQMRVLPVMEISISPRFTK